MRISAAAAVVVCLCGLAAIWVVPDAVWEVVLPSFLRARPMPAAPVVAALPTTRGPAGVDALFTTSSPLQTSSPATVSTDRAAVSPLATPTATAAPAPTRVDVVTPTQAAAPTETPSERG